MLITFNRSVKTRRRVNILSRDIPVAQSTQSTMADDDLWKEFESRQGSFHAKSWIIKEALISCIEALKANGNDLLPITVAHGNSFIHCKKLTLLRLVKRVNRQQIVKCHFSQPQDCSVPCWAFAQLPPFSFIRSIRFIGKIFNLESSCREIKA